MPSRLKTSLSITIIAAAAFAAILRGTPPAQAGDERLVLAFYYPWYDNKTWNSGKVPDVPQTPYNSDNRAVMARQVDQAKNAGIDAFVLNWWGKKNRTEKNLKALLDVAAEKGFRVSVDFDINSPVMHGPASYAEHLRHLHTVHAAHPAYLRYQGRPVVFFYNVSRLSVDAWRNIRNQADPERKALWIAEGTEVKYLSVFDGHHLYSVTWRNNVPPSQTLPKWAKRVAKYNRQHGTAKLWVATVMPGYDDRKVRPGSGFARSRDGGNYYRQCWQAAIASEPAWVIVNSFNEWPEGTYIEPSRAYGSLYLDLTREWSAKFKGADLGAQVQLPPPATPTPVPPKPTPIPPKPTPTPPPYLLDGQVLPLPDRPGVGCGYLLAPWPGRQDWQDGAGRYWTIQCNTDVTANEVSLIY